MHVRIYMELTLNGLICRADDTVSWTEAAWNSYFEACTEYGNLVIGRRSFETIPPEESEQLKQLALVVVSTSLLPEQMPEFVRALVRTPQAALDWLKTQGFKRALIGGGTTLNTAFLKDGLVDEITVDLEPMLFASGKPLFGPLPGDLPLKLLSHRQTGPDSVQLSYQVLKP